MPAFSRRAPPSMNDDPLSEPAFLAGLEAAGYLQRLDTSEARITARYQHALSKMSFASHSEEFLTRAGVRKVHRSTVQFFTEEPTPMDPFVHVMCGSLPPSRPALVTPRGCQTSSWTPIGSDDEADGTIHFTVTHPGFWPVTVVFDCNRQDLDREDRYSSIRAGDDDSESDPEAYLPPSGSRRRRDSRRDSMMDDEGYRSSRGGRRGSRQPSYAAYDDEDSTSDGDDNDYTRSGRRASRRAERRQSMSARDLDDAIAGMSLGRSNSRASMRRSSSRASRRGY